MLPGKCNTKNRRHKSKRANPMHRREVLMDRDGIPIHRRGIPMGRGAIPMHRREVLMDRDGVPTRRRGIPMGRGAIPMHRREVFTTKFSALDPRNPAKTGKISPRHPENGKNTGF